MSVPLFFARNRFICNFNRKLFFVLLLIVIVINILLYLLLFSRSCAKTITLEEMPNFLVPAPYNLELLPDGNKIQMCDIMPKLLNSVLPKPNVTVTDFDEKKLQLKLGVQDGGAWEPSKCISQHHVAIIVPYRDRLSNLQVFLSYMHPFLQAQKLNYQIFIVEQTSQRPFNRAKLFNVGFKEAEKFSSFHCYIFHDVDLLPQNLHNVYGCTQLPRHMSAYVDVFDYKLPYDVLFGGAVAILKSHFENVNGFSNNFYGWGGEDDDFFNRVTRNGTRICRYEYNISKYIMLTHKKEKPSEDRFFFLQTGNDRFKTDGLNSLKYIVLRLDRFSLYTRILVDI